MTVDSYRAPSFSITQKSIWALDVLAEEGFKYDSSIFPIVHDRYGIPGAKTGIHQIETKSGRLWEFPPSIRKLGKLNLPVSGGGYFRLYPYLFTANSFQQINQGSQRPFMFYIHPWEIDPSQMRMDFASFGTRFRHYVNLKSTYGKLERLLTQFQFGRVADVIANHSPTVVEPRQSGVVIDNNPCSTNLLVST